MHHAILFAMLVTTMAPISWVMLLTFLGVIGFAAAPVLPQPGREQNQSPRWEPLHIVLAANASQDATININNHNAKFKSLMVNGTGVFSCLIQINGRALMSSAVHSANMFGTGQLPFQLAVPISVQVGDQINITLEDLSGNQNTLDIAFHGYEYD
jgi:hypothetical protein